MWEDLSFCVHSGQYEAENNAKGSPQIRSDRDSLLIYFNIQNQIKN